jgi:thiol-disulfide isomerase/thioredoxin
MTRLIALAALYLSALPAFADPAAWAALREGDMRKLVIHDSPRPVDAEPFTAGDGGEMTLDAFRGQVVVLNFWATWCPPCIKEMPMLDALNRDMGSDEFRVVTIATGRNSPAAMKRFFEEAQIETLPLHNDTTMAMARGMSVLGLPVTVILDREGQEIARMQGEATWDGESARAVLAAMIEDTR